MPKVKEDFSPLVLIIDVDISTTLLLRGVFEREGYRIETSEDGATALRLAVELSPDVIVLETRLKGNLDGFQVLQRLRENPQTARIPTFLLTSSSDWPEAVEGLRLGADDYVRKPIHPKELLARAEAKIRSYRLDQALTQRTHDLEALLRVGEVLTQSHDWDTIAGMTLSLAAELLPNRCVGLAMVTGGQLSQVDGIPPTSVPEVITALRAVLSSDSTTPKPNQLVSFLAFSQDTARRVALIVLGHDDYNDHHIQLFEGLCKQASLALQNAELYRIQANYAQELENKVEERTQALQAAQRHLVQADRMAAIGRLAAGIAHEINNPLMPIRFNLESLIEDAQSNLPLDKELLDVTLNSVERIQNLVKRLLHFNEGRGAGEHDYNEPVNIKEVCQNVLELTRKTFQQSDKKITVQVDNLPAINGNRDALTQVFINLALNACESMQRGGQLVIDGKLEAANRQVVVRFEDTGEGIPPELIDHIFDPFVTTKSNGSGLGLFVSYGIIQAHNGSIRVESKVGRGTTFYLSFPVPEA